MNTVKSLEDIVATLVVIDKAYKNRQIKSIQISVSRGQPIFENRDTPTREVLSEEFGIEIDSANRRLQNLLSKRLIEVDPDRSYQGWKAYQRIYRLTGKGLQFLMLNV